MSRIATATELQGVLEDYKIHLTGDNPSSGQSEAPTAVTNPPGWPTDHRRVPNYRPVDKNRDVEGRPNGESAFGRGFLTIMFTGVVMNAVSDNFTIKVENKWLTIMCRLLRRRGELRVDHFFLGYLGMP
jgi:hypothetical protein